MDKGVDFIFQFGVQPVVLAAGVADVVVDPAVNKGMADGITDVVAEVSAEIGQSPGLLLPGADLHHLLQIVDKKFLYMVFVHIGTDIAVIPVAENGNLVEKHVRSLQSQLVQPAVLGNDML